MLRQKLNSIVQVMEALHIGVQGIGMSQVSNPVRKSLGKTPIQPSSKKEWKIEARGIFQKAIADSKAITKSAQKQREVILLNNPRWDDKGHPFPKESIHLFLRQIELLNYQLHINPIETSKELAEIEKAISSIFVEELGSIDGAAGKILHSTVAKLAILRLIVMYATSLDDAVHQDIEEQYAPIIKLK